ncbi:MAG TPA: ferritin-like domain-containing protein [Gemmataceae bacterium]|nr:ferritin-like domain-containing protein [Gemmataceae bacterium]
MKMKSLKDLLAEQLKDLYSAENQLVKALPKMAKAAENEQLRHGFEQHLEQTRHQVERIEKICERLDITPKGKKCTAMVGLITEGKELMSEDADADVLDAGLIAAAQKVEHYEIASYGSARTWAEQLGLREAVSLLEETLNEEKETDQKLSHLATEMINEHAKHGEDGDGEPSGRQHRELGQEREHEDGQRHSGAMQQHDGRKSEPEMHEAGR